MKLEKDGAILSTNKDKIEAKGIKIVSKHEIGVGDTFQAAL